MKRKSGVPEIKTVPDWETELVEATKLRANLLPCPFCGTDTVWVDDTLNCVQCHCGATAPCGENFDHAVKLWNERSNLDAGSLVYNELVAVRRLLTEYLK